MSKISLFFVRLTATAREKANSGYRWAQDRVKVRHAFNDKISRLQLPPKLVRSVPSVMLINDILLSP
jgi:hypothetical protein